jgi:biopolymer transport protein ExbD
VATILARRRVYMLPASEPNVIPFIDVLLVLLIIFMVTAPTPTTDLRVDMPRAGPARAVTLPPTMVSVREMGGLVRIYVDDEEVSAADLSQRALAHVLASNAALTTADALDNARIFVRADLDVAYDRVVSVVDALQRAQFRKVAIAAQQA